MNTNLVIIPAGPNALFQQWPDYSAHNFDLAIINWGDYTLHNTECANIVEHIQGQKWRIIGEFANKYDLSQYEYIWCLDDDCLTSPALIEATFNFCKTHNLDLAQPALAAGSYNTHPSTLHIPDAKMHITNTVEIMCPIFSQAAWPVCSEHFDKMPLGVGYGLEGYWSDSLDSLSGTTKFGGQVAVIDQYPVVHTKPVTGPHEYARMGIDPNDDGMYFHRLGFGWAFNTVVVVK